MISIPERLRSLINSAGADGVPIVAASVDAEGQPHLAHYGTIQVFSGAELALWVRKPGNLLARLATNPRMSFIYWNRAERTLIKLRGTSRITLDAAEREAIFVNSPPSEQALDPQRSGIAIIVALEVVEGSAGGEPIQLETGS